MNMAILKRERERKEVFLNSKTTCINRVLCDLYIKYLRLTAHRDNLNNEIKRGVLSQPATQCINMPPSSSKEMNRIH